MSKLDEIRRTSGSSISESIGGGRPPGATIPGEFRAGPSPLPLKLHGVKRRVDVSDIPVEKIGPDPDQPRKHFDKEAIDRLAQSLKSRGQLQPIRVRWNAERGQYVVIVGERRYQAATRAGLQTLACVVVEGDIPPDEMLAIQLVENCVREGLLPIEQARAFKSLMDARGWSQVDLAAELGIGQPAIAKALATLRLAPEIQDQVNRGQLSASAGAAIAAIESPEEQAEIAERAIADKLSRDEVVEVVRERVARSKPAKGRGASKAKEKPLPKEHTIKVGDNRKVVVSGRKGFDRAGLLAALEEAAAKVRVEIGDDQAAA